MSNQDIQIAVELTAHMNIFSASRMIAELLNIPLDVAFNFLKIVRL